MRVSPLLVATDGDDDTITLLNNNVNSNNANVIVDNVYWGDHHHFVEKYPDGFDIVIGMSISISIDIIIIISISITCEVLIFVGQIQSIVTGIGIVHNVINITTI